MWLSSCGRLGRERRPLGRHVPKAAPLRCTVNPYRPEIGNDAQTVTCDVHRRRDVRPSQHLLEDTPHGAALRVPQLVTADTLQVRPWKLAVGVLPPDGPRQQLRHSEIAWNWRREADREDLRRSHIAPLHTRVGPREQLQHLDSRRDHRSAGPLEHLQHSDTTQRRGSANDGPGLSPWTVSILALRGIQLSEVLSRPVSPLLPHRVPSPQQGPETALHDRLDPIRCLGMPNASPRPRPPHQINSPVRPRP